METKLDKYIIHVTKEDKYFKITDILFKDNEDIYSLKKLTELNLINYELYGNIDFKALSKAKFSTETEAIKTGISIVDSFKDNNWFLTPNAFFDDVVNQSIDVLDECFPDSEIEFNIVYDNIENVFHSTQIVKLDIPDSETKVTITFNTSTNDLKLEGLQ